MTLTRAAWILCLGAVLMPVRPVVAAWTALGPFGGSAAIVATDPHSSKTVIVGTRNALLFRSSDAGESWTPLPFPAQLRAVLEALVVDPRNPGVYMAGLSSELPQYSGILRSTDSGVTWQQVPALRGLQVRAIAFFRGNRQVLAAGTDHGVFRSRDGGIEWTPISPADNPELQPIVSIAFDPKDGAVLYAGTPHLPWKSEDDGQTWHSVYSGMIDDSDIFSILVDRNRRQRVFAGACSGIFRSLNGGSTWTRGSPVASGRTYVIVQDPQYENVLFAGAADGMMRSADGGDTWQRILPHATRSIAFDLGHLGRIYIATDEMGVLRSEDNGKTWRPVNNGFCNRRLTSLATAGSTLYTGAFDGLADGWALSLEKGTTQWQRVLPASRLIANQHTPVTIVSGSAGNLFAATPGAMLVSADAGRNWSRMRTPDAESPLTGLIAPAWAPNLLVAGSASGLFISENSGASWESVELSAAKTGVRALGASGSPWIAAVGTAGLFLSANGKTWRSGTLPPGVELYEVVAIGGSSLRAASSGGLRASEDLGASWEPVPGPLEGNTVQALARHALEPSVLFAAQFGIIYSSQDTGRSWTRISPQSWPVTSVKQLVMVPGVPDRLFVLTPQQGVFAVDLETGIEAASAGR